MSYQQKLLVERLLEAQWTALSAKVQTRVIGLVEENRQLKRLVGKLEKTTRRRYTKNPDGSRRYVSPTRWREDPGNRHGGNTDTPAMIFIKSFVGRKHYAQ